MWSILKQGLSLDVFVKVNCTVIIIMPLRELNRSDAILYVALYVVQASYYGKSI